MQQLSNVQQKIHCVFDSVVIEEPTSKRTHQPYKVLAGDTIRKEAIDCDIHNACATEKIDGTCTLIEMWNGRPWLWARHDRKPHKIADKRFKKYQAAHRQVLNEYELCVIEQILLVNYNHN